MARWWWCTPLISALGMQRQEDLYECKGSLQSEFPGSKSYTKKKPISRNKQKSISLLHDKDRCKNVQKG